MHSYDHIRKLGQGAFGEVALARAVETGEVVALKRIYIRDASSGGLPDNVIREIKCMQSLEHPNIVELKDVFAKGSSMVLVQEYCATDLASLLRKQHCRLPERCVKGLMQQMLRGLAACHAAGIMHRDIKPSNVMLTHGGCAKLGDFGLGRPFSLVPPAPGARPAAYTHTVATRWYRAPELLYGAKEYSPAVDVWALGAVLAEMLGSRNVVVQLHRSYIGIGTCAIVACSHRLWLGPFGFAHPFRYGILGESAPHPCVCGCVWVGGLMCGPHVWALGAPHEGVCVWVGVLMCGPHVWALGVPHEGVCV
ncbi:kinase-like domain-containing protein [Dunaliella salina]|uniref:cyclin-dependent kinase n=1 Tax=Dunaliella salina TaxID=3046 RepID=A0ABQ7GVA7_DUNSA|nr:kinase-like domain-containing protein [Dunaliella salina]|eukprot:KAF5838518.1 kinase-like domain-containing protein [Dunaliella salina]